MCISSFICYHSQGITGLQLVGSSDVAADPVPFFEVPSAR